MALKLAPVCVDGQSVRKLWTARVLFLLAAVALLVVVIEERRAQEADREPLQTICWSSLDAGGKRDAPGLRRGACADYRPARAPESR
jgi:hypothetical protein